MENKTTVHRTEYELLQRIKVRAYMEEDEVLAGWIRDYASLQCAEMKEELEKLKISEYEANMSAARKEAEIIDLYVRIQDMKERISAVQEAKSLTDDESYRQLQEEVERLRLALDEKTIQVMYAESWYELADISYEFGVTWMHIYDEPPSRHVDRVKWASITNIRIKPFSGKESKTE